MLLGLYLSVTMEGNKFKVYEMITSSQTLSQIVYRSEQLSPLQPLPEEAQLWKVQDVGSRLAHLHEGL